MTELLGVSPDLSRPVSPVASHHAAVFVCWRCVDTQPWKPRGRAWCLGGPHRARRRIYSTAAFKVLKKAEPKAGPAAAPAAPAAPAGLPGMGDYGESDSDSSDSDDDD